VGWQGASLSGGSPGWQGTPGLFGIQGPQGSQGSQGWQGWQGNQGSIGPQGITQTFRGIQGPQTGFQGTNGQSGPSGFMYQYYRTNALFFPSTNTTNTFTAITSSNGLLANSGNVIAAGIGGRFESGIPTTLQSSVTLTFGLGSNGPGLYTLQLGLMRTKIPPLTTYTSSLQYGVYMTLSVVNDPVASSTPIALCTSLSCNSGNYACFSMLPIFLNTNTNITVYVFTQPRTDGTTDFFQLGYTRLSKEIVSLAGSPLS
jgi:hypothetical protein